MCPPCAVLFHSVSQSTIAGDFMFTDEEAKEMADKLKDSMDGAGTSLQHATLFCFQPIHLYPGDAFRIRTAF